MSYICYSPDVKRTTIFLPESLHRQLREDAFRANVSMAELIRAKLQESAPRGRREASPDPILKVAGLCRGPVISEGIDDALYGV